MYIYLFIYLSIYLFVYLFMFIYIYIYTHPNQLISFSKKVTVNLKRNVKGGLALEGCSEFPAHWPLPWSRAHGRGDSWSQC